ncbi:unnamed protein product, partial [Mesorhabditis spiculigera]
MLIALACEAACVPVVVVTQTFKFFDKVLSHGNVSLMGREDIEILQNVPASRSRFQNILESPAAAGEPHSKRMLAGDIYKMPVSSESIDEWR